MEPMKKMEIHRSESRFITYPSDNSGNPA